VAFKSEHKGLRSKWTECTTAEIKTRNIGCPQNNDLLYKTCFHALLKYLVCGGVMREEKQGRLQISLNLKSVEKHVSFKAETSLCPV